MVIEPFAFSSFTEIVIFPSDVAVKVVATPN